MPTPLKTSCPFSSYSWTQIKLYTKYLLLTTGDGHDTYILGIEWSVEIIWFIIFQPLFLLSWNQV